MKCLARAELRQPERTALNITLLLKWTLRPSEQ